MRAGILGFTGSGRKTLFKLLTKVGGTDVGRTSRIGILKVPDSRLLELARLHASKKTTHATIEFVLIPRLFKNTRGNAKEVLDLAALRNVDVLVHVVRAFDNPSVPHPETTIAPSRDIEFLELELLLADLGLVERRLERMKSDARKGNKPNLQEMELLEHARSLLEQEKPLREAMSREERAILRGYTLLTAKPMLNVVNVNESDSAKSDLIDKLELSRWNKASESRITFISAQIEAEIAELPLDDAYAFRADLGITEDTIERIVRAAFELMGVITFYTASETDARAWILSRGTVAQKAAGIIHTDIERGFIRAEVIPFEQLVEQGSWNACRDKGLLRLEGKDYLLLEGDVVFFRFNV